MKDMLERVLEEVRTVVVGQEETTRLAVLALCCRGHVLLEGPPGVAKTLIAQTLARALDVEMRRVQFTPDMLPADLTGTMALRGQELVFRAGPVFTNLLLADEINRTPPKTQAALLEAMQEGQVSVDGQTFPLERPFMVLATQNPIEYEGTYPLPEAQLDRFLLKLSIGYPSSEQEELMLGRDHDGGMPCALADVRAVADASQLALAAEQARAITVSEAVIGYVVALVRRTRELPSVSLGASSRAAVHLLSASKAAACLEGRTYVTPDDVIALAAPALAHRLVMAPEAELERFGAADAIRAALADVPVPR